MKRVVMLTLTTTALLCLVVAPTAGDAGAQRRQQLVFKVDATNSKYTQQYTIDVGDVPGHQVRLFEVHRTYPRNPPVINGMNIVESWTRGASDYTNNNGAAIRHSCMEPINTHIIAANDAQSRHFKHALLRQSAFARVAGYQSVKP